MQKVYLNLTMNIAKENEPINTISNKMKVGFNTTAFNLIEKMCSKLMTINQDLVIDINKKILKVKGLNDYIFDINEPMVNYTYFVECIKLNKIPEYLIVDNPILDVNIYNYISNEKEQIDITRSSLMPTSTLSEIDLEDKNNDTIRKTTIIAPNLKGKNDLEKIAFYDKNKEENKNKEKRKYN